MSIDETTFEIHDISEFPVVRSKGEAVHSGYAPQWEREMEALVAHGEIFVMIFEGERGEETHEDQKHRGLWLKRNKEKLGHVCKALVSIEENDVKRLASKAQSAMAERAFGIPMRVVASNIEATISAKAILSIV